MRNIELGVVENPAIGRKRRKNECHWTFKVPTTTKGMKLIAEMRKLAKGLGKLRLRGRGPRKIYERVVNNPYDGLPIKYSRYVAVYFSPIHPSFRNYYSKEKEFFNRVYDSKNEFSCSDDPIDLNFVDRI